VNVGGTENIIRAAKVCNVGRLVYASSSSVYGLAAEDGIPDEDEQPIPKTRYAAQKLDGERVVLLANTQARVTTAVRQATAMGPAPRMRLDTVVNIFSKQAFFDGVITPYGGDQFRSNVHVQDVVRFYRLLLTHEGIAGKPWNLTQGNFTVRDIAAAVQTVAGEEGIKAVVETVDVEDSRSYRMDGSRAEKQLGFKCVRTIADAVRDNFRWFQRGAIDPDDPIYRNNARMGDLVTKGE
jgi:nucleoside-diphosphate-sugar epimerase